MDSMSGPNGHHKHVRRIRNKLGQGVGMTRDLTFVRFSGTFDRQP
jgi:hypothetical protein